MNYAISMVTMNRAPVLRRVLDGILATTQAEQPAIVVTNNASTDDTRALLDEYEAGGKIRAWHIPENLGTAGGRNAHWQHCIGHDAIRMDDKVLPLAAGWLTAMKRQADQQHAIVATPYDPTVLALLRIAPAVEFVRWDNDAGRGGPLIFIPAEATEALGGMDEYTEGDERCLYGWDDCALIERAVLLGWGFGFSLRVPVEYLTQANPARRAGAMRWHRLYMERRRQYEAAERDVFIPIESTTGHQAGMEVRG